MSHTSTLSKLVSQFQRNSHDYESMTKQINQICAELDGIDDVD